MEVVPFHCCKCNAEMGDASQSAICAICKHSFCLKHIILDPGRKTFFCEKCSLENSAIALVARKPYALKLFSLKGRIKRSDYIVYLIAYSILFGLITLVAFIPLFFMPNAMDSNNAYKLFMAIVCILLLIYKPCQKTPGF